MVSRPPALPASLPPATGANQGSASSGRPGTLVEEPERQYSMARTERGTAFEGEQPMAPGF
ncbi:hypothetical protein [Streptomyces sp. NPDC005374]|uniref:hypothetical protein n=1 Tax=Streptomyces sp. NPDC005374 TaxID=3364713 RepID=UPI0036C98307